MRNPVVLSPVVRAPVAFVVTVAVAIVPCVGDGPCLEHRISIDEPCAGQECWYTTVGATEVDGVRHVVWRQNDAAPRVRTARIEPHGTVLVGELTFDAPPSSIHGLALRGDLLAVGVDARVELLRLVAHQWVHEAVLTAPMPFFAGRRIAIDRGPIERIAVSSVNLVGSPGGGALGSPVTVFRNDGGWTLEQIIEVPPGSPFDRPFGADIALHGSTLAIGRPWLNQFSQLGGEEIRIYEFIDGAWTATQTLLGEWWTPPGTGHRLALVGDTLVATNASGNPWSANGFGFTINLQIFRRGNAGFEPSDFVFGTTAIRRGWELSAHEHDGDVLVYSSVHRQQPVITGAFRLRIRDGVVIEEIDLPVPPSDLEGMVTPIWGIAAVDGSEPWVAVTAPTDPAGSSVSIIGVSVPEDSCPTPPLGDLDGNGIVDGADLGLLLAQWGYCIGCPGDLDGDGFVDGADLGMLLDNWTIDGGPQ